MQQVSIPAHYLDRAQAVADAVVDLSRANEDAPRVLSVVLSGSLTGPLADGYSDLDIYVYSDVLLPLAARAALADAFAGADNPTTELDNPYWGTEDAWIDAESGLLVELMYRSPEWISAQLDRVLVQHQGSVGYSTAFWYNVRHALPLVDDGGWYAALQARAGQPYPDALRRSVLQMNYPLLRTVHASFRHQIALAIARRDRISVNHRVAALLASYFDVLFALNGQPHPGEKRLIPLAKRLCKHLPDAFAQDIDALLVSVGDDWAANTTLQRIDTLLDHLDALLVAANLLTPGGELV